MMRAKAGIFTKQRPPDDEDARILPLINIVFLLLIFFMVVGKLSAADPFEITPPRSASDGEPANEPMLIAIGPEGQLALKGALIDEASLVMHVAEAEHGTALRIKSDGRVAATRLVNLLERLRIVGVESVRLMTVPADRNVPSSGTSASEGR